MKRPAIVGSGFMADYMCTAKCRHCMYGCSNHGNRDYVSAEDADRIMKKLSEAGVTDLHIGGGEPFLNFEGLLDLIKAMNRYHIAVDYIETNGFWCNDRKRAEEKLLKLRALGVDTVMVSCDPFHIEYVPLRRVITFVEAARSVGMGYFVWQDRFFKRLSVMDLDKVHTEEELKAVLGKDYAKETASEYGIGMNGRALTIAREIYPMKSAREAASKRTCSHMLRGHHCHVDLYGNVVPAGCTGIAISIEDFTEKQSELYDAGKHPVIARLLSGGTAALLDYAVSLGFPEDTLAATSCDLCYKIRRFLHENTNTPDIGPDCFYEMMES